MFSILVTELDFKPCDHRNRCQAHFIVTASEHSNFSNSVDRNVPSCDKQSVEDVGSYKDCLFKKCTHWPSQSPALGPGPRLHVQTHPALICPYSSSMGKAQSHTAALNHMGSKMVQPDFNPDLFVFRTHPPRQWFSTEAIWAPEDIWQCLETFLVCHTQEVLLAPSWQRPAMLFSILQCTRQPLQPRVSGSKCRQC